MNYLLVKRNQKFFKFLGLTSKKECRDNFDSEKVIMKAFDFTMMDVKINPNTNFFGYTRNKKISGYPNEKYKLEGVLRRPRVSEAVGGGKGGREVLDEKIFLLDFNRFTQYMHYAYYALAMELWPFHWFKFSTNNLGGINFRKRKDLYFSVFLIMHEIIGKGFLSEFSLKRIMKKTSLFKSVHPKIVIKKTPRSANDLDEEYNPKSIIGNLEQICNQSFVEQYMVSAVSFSQVDSAKHSKVSGLESIGSNFISGKQKHMLAKTKGTVYDQFFTYKVKNRMIEAKRLSDKPNETTKNNNLLHPKFPSMKGIDKRLQETRQPFRSNSGNMYEKPKQQSPSLGSTTIFVIDTPREPTGNRGVNPINESVEYESGY